MVCEVITGRSDPTMIILSPMDYYLSATEYRSGAREKFVRNKTMFWGLKYCFLLTILGTSWSSESPCPNRPYLPFPHVYMRPRAVKHAECAPPQAMATTSSPDRAVISLGRSQLLEKYCRCNILENLNVYTYRIFIARGPILSRFGCPSL